ncbi:MAG TPA: 30S ribosomal protein S6 [Pyrinomonadaceae bacterium]|nr:30S ribosomal protein S6 [Pyrinomonadaceae bacterium]
MANKRVYEIMYIVAPETADDDLTKINETIVQVIESQGGTIANTDNMGRRKLAYPIDKKTEGHYVLLEVEGTGKEILELERRMRVNDAIIRFITVRVDEDRKTADKQKAKRDARQVRRNVASNRGGANQESEQESAGQNQ